MGNLGPGELLIILLIAVVLFGAGRFADIGKGLGQGIRNFKKGMRDTEEDDEKSAKKDDKSANEKSSKGDKDGDAKSPKDEKASAAS